MRQVRRRRGVGRVEEDEVEGRGGRPGKLPEYVQALQEGGPGGGLGQIAANDRHGPGIVLAEGGEGGTARDGLEPQGPRTRESIEHDRVGEGYPRAVDAAHERFAHAIGGRPRAPAPRCLQRPPAHIPADDAHHRPSPSCSKARATS